MYYMDDIDMEWLEIYISVIYCIYSESYLHIQIAELDCAKSCILHRLGITYLAVKHTHLYTIVNTHYGAAVSRRARHGGQC